MRSPVWAVNRPGFSERLHCLSPVTVCSKMPIDTAFMSLVGSVGRIEEPSEVHFLAGPREMV